ncbi:MAG TPA: DNA-3-methyladenine glycosylase 2 family protein [Dehalococcoidia bacterium]|nr:DNA-3-methyladenine glycosylase 2 family protein [Dehalococcoidia bacterium]
MEFSVDEALAHLRKTDPALAAVIDRVGAYDAPRRADPYAALVRAILFQQLAGAAASAIQRKFFALYSSDDRPPTPAEMLETSDEKFRSAGVSRQKAGYLRDLAAHVADERLNLTALPSLPDEEVIESITAVKGLGEWSAHMFLMFHLGRPDVLPIGDLGVRNGMRITYGLPAMPTPKEALVIGAPWAPFRSVGSWYMWRATEPVAPDI